MSSARVLYLSYDGMTDPLGRSQVLPYLEGLAARGHHITLASFEKPTALPSERAVVARLCGEAGIEWRPMRYRKRLPIFMAIQERTMSEFETRAGRGPGLP